MTKPTIKSTAPDWVISSALAEHVMGWKEKDSSFEECQWEDRDGERHAAPDCTCLDTMVAMIERRYGVYKVEFVSAAKDTAYRVDLFRSLDDAEPDGYALANDLAKAISLALLRAHGVKVVD